MNGQPLPRDHGFPVRLLAPGTAGCRNVKWVRNISVTAAASELDSGSKLDRHFAPDVEFKPAIRKGEEHLRLDQGPVIQTLPVQSIICDPLNASIVPGRRCMADACSIVDSVTVRGVAWSGGGRGICRVEVSGDGGEKFTAAELNRTYKTSTLPARAVECDVCVGDKCPAPLQLDAPPPQQGVGRNWAWKQFEEVIPLSAEQVRRLYSFLRSLFFFLLTRSLITNLFLFALFFCLALFSACDAAARRAGALALALAVALRAR